MKENLKQTKGITLIALIITIIILLILAMVSIRLVMNEGFLFRTKEATIRHTVAEVEEALKVKIQEEQITKSTTPNLTQEQTLYSDLLEEWLSPAGLEYYCPGNIYDKATEEILVKNPVWIPTEIIRTPDGMTQEEVNDGLGIPEFTPLNLNVELGNKGYLLKMGEEVLINIKTNPKDFFMVDANYHVYYIDEEGKVIYSANKTYKIGEDVILSQNKYINPDKLPEKYKQAYYGIYQGALAFTGDEKYASYLAQNDLDPDTTVNTFVINGYYNNYKIVNEKGEIVVPKIVQLMTRPDWSQVQLINDPSDTDYFMDSSYNMYEYNKSTRKLKDKDGTVIGELDTSGSSEGLEYNGYAYIERFDGRDVLICNVPDRETLDMATDLADLNVYAVNVGVFSDKSTKNVILPNTIKAIDPFAITRSMTDNPAGAFKNATNLEQITIPNNIQKIYANTFENCSNLKTVIMPDNLEGIGANAFLGCSNVTLKFKDGEAPAGHPWGGTNINITNK